MAKGTEITVQKGGKPTRMPGLAPFADFERMFDDFFGWRWLRPFAWQPPFSVMPSTPSVDVIDRDDEVVVRAEVPGYKKEEIEVSVSDGSVTIKGETKAEAKEKKGNYYRCEISRGSFARTLTLPAEVEDAKARASMHDGVLELTLPKREKAKRRSIAIA